MEWHFKYICFFKKTIFNAKNFLKLRGERYEKLSGQNIVIFF